MGAIGAELNCADIGAKNLTRNRLFGFIFMLKMINSIGDRIGEDEFGEFEHKERMRKGTKKILKGKNLHVGLLLLLANLHEATGVDPEGHEQGSGWSWTIFVVCALC